MWVLIIILLIMALIFIFTYCIRFDTIIAFTGGLGSGKSFLSVQYSIICLRKNRLKVFLKNLFRSKKRKLPKPQLYSNIPVKWRSFFKTEWSLQLTPEHLLLRKKIIPRSIVYIDEVGSFCSQFDFANPNIKDNFDEFMRLFRHYTLGGYLIVNDQCSENIVLQIRRRINTVFNLMQFRTWGIPFRPIVYSVKVRNVSISEEIKTVEEKNTEDNMSLKIGLMPLFRRYDTYCYSGKYEPLPLELEKHYLKFKKNKLLEIPKERYKKLTINED